MPRAIDLPPATRAAADGYPARRMIRAAAALVSAALLALAFWMLHGQTAGLVVTHATVGQTPVTVMARAGAPPGPAVVIAHGFAGSKQLMQPFAVTLARAGYTAVSYDALGHGRDPVPLTGDVTTEDGATARLLDQIAAVSDFAARLPQSDGRLALVGHSMSSDLVVREALADPRVAATVAVSLFSPKVTADAPRNLLVVTGALEPGLAAEAVRVAGLAANGAAAQPFTTYGDPAAGTGRRAVLSPRVEHLGVLFSPVSLSETRNWLNAVFGRGETPPVDDRGPWIGLWFAAVLGLGWSLAPLLPRVAAPGQAPAGGWPRLLRASLPPALLTPLIAWKLPEGLLPVPVADYLSLHFLIYGLLTLLFAGAWRWRAHGIVPARLVLATLAYAGFAVALIYLPLDRYVTAFLPTPARLPLLAMLLGGLLPYFVGDELLTRASGAPRGAYPFTKLCFLVSIGIAIALNPGRLFFLILILPVMLLFFILFGLLSRWSAHATGAPLAAGLANAALFAWAIAVTFPILGK